MRVVCGIFTLVLVAAIAGSAFAGVIYVKQNSPGPVFDGLSWDTAFHAVQAGVDAAVSGDEVRVAVGDYPESVMLKSGVKLRGGYAGSGDIRDIKANVSRIISCRMIGPCTLEGFTIHGSTEIAVHCLYSSGNAEVRYNTITGTQVYGVYTECFAVIEYNIISNRSLFRVDYGVFTSVGATVNANRVSNSQTGICCNGSARVFNNIVWDCITGVYDNSGINVYVANNLVYGCRNAGIVARNSQTVNNIVTDNGIGIHNPMASTLTLSCNNVNGNRTDYLGALNHNSDISADPKFENPEAGDFRLTPASPCINRGYNHFAIREQTDAAGSPRMYGNRLDIGPYEFRPEPRISVSPSNPILHIMDPGDTVTGVTQTYALTNIGIENTISWTAGKTADWLDISTFSGSIAPGESAEITVSVNASASSLPAGRYSDVVRITNIGTGEVATRNVRLIVGEAVCVNRNVTGTVHDGTSWEKAYPTIMEALEVALPGQEIWIAKGVYREEVDISKNVILKGGYLGEGDARDVKLHETTIERAGDYGDTIVAESPCTIDGFTITGGYDGVYGISGGPVTVKDCTIRGNQNAAAALKWVTAQVTSNTITGNKHGVILDGADSASINNLIYNNTGYGITLTNSASAIHNTLVNNGYGSGLPATSGYSVINNLVADSQALDLSQLFVNAPEGDFHLLPGAACIDVGTNEYTVPVDKDGNPRSRDGDGDGIAKSDFGCYEFGVSNTIELKQAKSLPDGTPVGLTSPVVTASLDNRFYVEGPDRINGIGIIGGLAPAGKKVAVEGIVDTVDGERVIRATSVLSGVTAPIPAPWFVNFNALGGGASGLQSGVSDWRLVKKTGDDGKPYWVRDLFSYGGANNIGLLVKMTGKVSNSSDGYFYLDGSAPYDEGDPAIKGVRVDWPFAATPPAEGAFVSILGISSCRVVSDDVAGDVVVRMLRPVSASAVKVLTN